MSYNDTYAKFNFHPFEKVMYGKKVGEIVPSKALENNKVVVKFDHWDNDDFVSETRLIHPRNLSKISKFADSSEEFVPKKKFGGDENSGRENRRNKAWDEQGGTIIIRRPARKNMKD